MKRSLAPSFSCLFEARLPGADSPDADLSKAHSVARYLSLLLCSLLFCISCQSGGGSKSKRGSDDMRPVRDLPQLQQQLLMDYSTGGEVWNERRKSLADDPELTQFLVDNLIVEMVRAFSSSRIETQLGERGPFERAQSELIRLTPAAAPTLAELMTMPDDGVVYVAVQTLKQMKREACLPVVSKLEDKSWKVRLRAAEILTDLQHAGSKEEQVTSALAQHLAKDEHWTVRAQCALAIGSRGSRDTTTATARERLENGLRDEDVGVAKRCIEGLGLLGDKTSVPTLIRCLEMSSSSGNFALLETCQTSLRQLTGLRGISKPKVWRARWDQIRRQ